MSTPADFTDLKQNRFPNWLTTPNRPAGDRKVTLLFKGLSLFSFNVNRCEIGFLNDDGDRKHPLRIEIKEDGQQHPRPIPFAGMTVALGTEPKVYFLKQNPASVYDFNNTLDLNNRGEFWPGATPQEEFNAKLIVNHGTFFCWKLTEYAFHRVDVPASLLEWALRTSNHQPSIRFTEIIACEIGLMADQRVTFVAKNKTYSLPEVANSCTVEFNNLCNDDGRECDFDYRSRFEKRRGDFHFHRECLDASPKYGLLFDREQLTEDGLDRVTGKKPQGTELAPCMPGGTGGGS